MMGWYGSGAMSGWGWTVGMIVFWAALITLVLAWRYRRRDPAEFARSPAGGALLHSERILAERYARGEIDEVEYSTRLTTLRQAEHS